MKPDDIRVTVRLYRRDLAASFWYMLWHSAPLQWLRALGYATICTGSIVGAYLGYNERNPIEPVPVFLHIYAIVEPTVTGWIMYELLMSMLAVAASTFPLFGIPFGAMKVNANEHGITLGSRPRTVTFQWRHVIRADFTKRHLMLCVRRRLLGVIPDVKYVPLRRTEENEEHLAMIAGIVSCHSNSAM